MQKEERSKGSVNGKGKLLFSNLDLVLLALVYAKYFAAAYGHALPPLLLFSAVFMQGTHVLSGYW